MRGHARFTAWLIVPPLSVALMGCAQSSQVRTQPKFAPIESSAWTTTESVTVAHAGPNPIALLQGNAGVSVVATTAPSKLGAADAMRRAHWLTPKMPNQTIVVVKAALSDYTVHDRIVWLVGVAPITLIRHGPGNQPPSPGEGVTVIDATTGEVLEGVSGGLPGRTY